MPDLTKHEPGMLCWADLATRDPDAAKRFYGALFGWQFRDEPIPGGGAYSQALLRGRTVVGLSAMQPQEETQGVPPHWNAYIAVVDVEKVCSKVVPAGGKVLAPPMDVMGQGRMAVLQDPTGGVLCLWQPLKHPGAGVAMEPGSLCWAELMTRDPRAAAAFYGKVLDWRPQEQDLGGGMKYTVFNVGEKAAVGMLEVPQEAQGMPSNWGVYFAVADIQKTLEQVQKLGGEVCMPVRAVAEVGQFTVLQDPQGAYFQVLQPEMR